MALAACEALGWRAAETTLLLVAHGARRDPRAQAPASRHAARITSAGAFAGVETAFLEADPPFRAWLDRPGARTIVVGLFLGRGRHVVEDVEQAIAQARPTIAYGGSVGDSAAIVSLGSRRVRRVLR
jgi:sirohydrochlorin ferrochelatase